MTPSSLRAPVAAFLDGARQHPVRLLPALLSLIVLLGFAFATPLSRLGDASDYLLMTESLYWDHDLKWEPRDQTRHLLLLRDARLDSPVGLQTTEGRDGILRLTGIHSFYYPALAAPFYAIFRYRGFYVLNALLCWSFLVLLVGHLREVNPPAVAWAAALLAVGFSAAWSYVVWIHAEIFLMTLCGVFAFLWRRGRLVAAGGVLGLLTGAQPVFAVLAIPFLAVQVANRSRFRTLAAAALLGLAAMAPQYLYYLRAFGSLHPLATSGRLRLESVTLDRFIRSLVDPAAGLIWFYPAVVVVLFWVRWDRLFCSHVIGALGVLLATFTSPSWYTHQVGLRYCAYIFPLFLFGTVSIPLRGFAPLLASAWLATAGAGLATNPVGNSRTMSIADKSFLPYQIARRFSAYPEHLEVLWYQTARLSRDVGILPGWTDGWTGGGEAVLFVQHAADTPSVTVDVRSWPRSLRAQHLAIVTEGGTSVLRDLSPSSLTPVEVPLGPRDIRLTTGRFGDVLILRLKADAWVPALEDPTSSDTRRLGIQVTRVGSREKTWLPPEPAPAH